MTSTSRASSRRPAGLGPRRVLAAARWLGRALRLRVERLARLAFEQASGQARLAQYPLGAQIATEGPRSAAVFASSGRAASASRCEYADIVLADEPGVTEGAWTDATVVRLSDLPEHVSVPAFDSLEWNPIGWKLNDASAVLASDVSDDADPAARAGQLAASAATGQVIRAGAGDPDLRSLLGAELYALMSDDDRINSADGHEREAISIDMRRHALRDHSLRARARQVIAAAGLTPPYRRVSVLLATCRPEQLDHAVAAVSSQTYPEIELVLALHGDGFTDAAVQSALAQIDRPVRVTAVAAQQPLGAVLNAAVEASTGVLLAKFDDDDYYSADHLWDLVLAQEFSQAELVAKGAEYVYLSSRDRTLRMFGRRGERYLGYPGVSGGAMLIARHHLDAAGGWRRIPRHVDTGLARDVVRVGGRIYRTHGRGYLRVRHGRSHTWDMDESHFLGRAREARDGLDLDFAGVA